MQHKKLIQSEIDFNQTFRYITKAYEEIAVLKMRKVRASVLSTRDYLSQLSSVFFELKKAKEKLASTKTIANKQKSVSTKSTSEKLSKKVSVLLSANTTLYGDLIGRIFQLFMKNVEKDNSDIIIVGRVGKRMYDEQENKKPYIYFEIPDVEIRLEELKPVIFHLVKYQQIQVYYGKFESIVNQNAISSSISGDNPYAFQSLSHSGERSDSRIVVKNNDSGQVIIPSGENRGTGMTKVASEYLFEPDLDKILSFFEGLIASSLFRQTVHETQLARWASRILSMEKAQTNIDLAIKKLHFSRAKIQKQDENKKQLDRLAGLSLWRR